MEEGLAPLLERGILVRVYHFDEASQEWTFYDPRPEFGAAISLTEMVPGQSYCFEISQNETVNLGGAAHSFPEGWILFTWNVGGVSFLGQGEIGRRACGLR